MVYAIVYGSLWFNGFALNGGEIWDSGNATLFDSIEEVVEVLRDIDNDNAKVVCLTITPVTL